LGNSISSTTRNTVESGVKHQLHCMGVPKIYTEPPIWLEINCYWNNNKIANNMYYHRLDIELPKENHRAAASMTDDLYLGSSFI
jgi:uncharacterized Zn-finger protein